MRTTSESFFGRAVLLLSHVAGIVDLVALPLWVGGLVATGHFSAQQAGMLVTLYILGVLVSNLALGPRFDRLNGRVVVTLGFGLCAACFFGLTQAGGMGPYAALHLLGGLGAGAGLSCVHGTIGRSANPHRLFAVVNIGVGVFGILFFAAVPPLMQAHGVDAVFVVLGGLMAAAALASLAAFPVRTAAVAAAPGLPSLSALDVRVLAFAGVVLMTAGQSAIFSFVERVGVDHGFPAGAIGTMLVIAAFINLLSPILAGLLQSRLSPTAVAVGGLFLHGCASLAITQAMGFPLYAVAASMPVFLVVFSHVFMFGLIAKLDRNGRMAALTPAMMMIGTAVGPLLGGVMVSNYGYGALGVAAAGLAWASALCYLLVRLRARVFEAPLAGEALAGTAD